MYTHVMACNGVKLRDDKNSGDVGLPGFSGEIGLAPLTPMTGFLDIPLVYPIPSTPCKMHHIMGIMRK